MNQKRLSKKPGKSTPKARPSTSSGKRPFASILSAAGSDRNLILIVFLIAITVRLIYWTEYRDVPFYDHPFGDSDRYHQRAVEIVSGDFLGKDAYFLGSPLYPYFLAAIYKIFGVNFTLLRIIQFLIGSINCVLIYLLTRTVVRKNPAAALVAGLMAAVYGTLAYFDGTILMTSLELFFICLSLLLLAYSLKSTSDKYGTGDSRRWSPRRGAVIVFIAGIMLGLAGLGRPNILVFAPFALLWILTRFGRSFVPGQWRRGLLFTLGCCLAVSPITIRNYIVSQDFVLVSNSAGINFFIGNNDEANGCLSIPGGSGLNLALLDVSSRDAAQAATGQADMKPSEVSRYWAARGFEYWSRNPAAAAKLLVRKFSLFWNHYEIPNIHHKYFIADAYAPSLRWLFVGFGITAPLALIGIVLLFGRRLGSPPARLFLGFIVVYSCSVLPFFITARYRIPVVPFLLIFASIGLVELAGLAVRRRLAWLSAMVILGIASGILVNRTVIDAGYWFSRAIVGKTHSEIAQERPEIARPHLEEAIVELKKAIELAPHVADSHYYLGVAYQLIGYHSGAIQSFEAALERDPAHGRARSALNKARAALEQTGDRVGAESLPQTPFERAEKLFKAGQTNPALLQLQRAVKEDPHHARAHNQIGSIYFGRKDFESALSHYLTALRYSQNNAVLLDNIAATYYEKSDYVNARRYWEKSLEIKPGNEKVIRRLQNLPSR